MKITVIYDGKEYESEDSDEMKTEEIAERLYEQLEENQLNRFKMKLKDGGFLLLGEYAIQSAVIIIKDT